MTSSHYQFTLSPDSDYCGHLDPVRRVELRAGDIVIECASRNEIISLASWAELEECPFCNAPTIAVIEETAPHNQVALNPDSDYCGRLDPVRRVEFRAGDIVIECVKKKEAISLAGWGELKECPFCGEPTGNLVEVPLPPPLKKPTQDDSTPQYEAGRRRFAGLPISALVILLLIACLGVGGVVAYASLNGSNGNGALPTAAPATRRPTIEASATSQPTAVASATKRPTVKPSATPKPTTAPQPATEVSATQIPPSIQFRSGVSGLGTNQLLYASDDSGYWSIYVRDIDSDEEVLLLGGGSNNNSAPVWSPDGTQIAFHSQRNDNWDIYVMDADGNNVRRLTTHENGDLFPTWSPDGTQLAFHSTRNGNYDLYSIDIASGDLRQLTSDSALEASPSWSPDGRYLVYEAKYSGNSDIYLLDLTDLSRQELVSRAGNDEGAAWSPDGTKIAFGSEQSGQYEIFIINIDGSGLLQLTSNNVNDVFPVWSPDGSQIVYESWQDGKIKLFIMNADGSGQRQLLEKYDKQRFPDWLR
jgi:Tol biopolymer transport system component/uncharacterized CHY-type Zn-finger protein